MPHFENLKDPRHETKNKLPKLNDIFDRLGAVLSGIEDWAAMEEFTEKQEA